MYSVVDFVGFQLVALCIFTANNLFCNVVAELEFSSVNEYCVIWYNEHHVFVSHREKLYLITVRNYIRPLHLMDWTSMSQGSEAGSKNVNCSTFVSAVEIINDVVEICGFVSRFIQCQIYTMNNSLLKWQSTRQLAYVDKANSFKTHFQDGYLIQVTLNTAGQYPSMQMRTVVPEVRIPTDVWYTDYTTIGRTRPELVLWSNEIETSNHMGAQFTAGTQLRFHGFAVAPGRRYLLFNEVAKEATYRETYWSRNFKEITYTRIARVCTGDPGLKMPNDGRVYFTSFLKTRLICRVSVEQLHVTDSSSRSRSTETIDFDHMVAMTQVWPSVGVTDDTYIYGLFTSFDPTIDRPMKRLRLSLPMAICAYRLADVDNTIHQSDLIKLFPDNDSPVFTQRTKYVNSTDRTVALNQFPQSVAHHRSGMEMKYQRIRRFHSEELATITDCPGPSRSNRRLMLEAPLLADPVHSFGRQPIGLVNIPSQVTVIRADPRFIHRPVNSPLLNSSTGGTISVFYVGTDVGDVFKLIILMNTSNHVPQSDLNRTVLQHKLIHMSKSRSIQSILPLKMNKDKQHTIIAEHGNHRLKPSDEIKLLILDGKHMMKISTFDCSHATNCRDCMEMGDPECFWNPQNKQCDHTPIGTLDLWRGRYSLCDCEEIVPDTSTTPASVKQLSNSNVPTTSVLSHRNTTFEYNSTSKMVQYIGSVRTSSEYFIVTVSTCAWAALLASLFSLTIGVLVTLCSIRCRRRKCIRLVEPNLTPVQVNQTDVHLHDSEIYGNKSRIRLKAQPLHPCACGTAASAKDLFCLSAPKCGKIPFAVNPRAQQLRDADMSTVCLNNEFNSYVDTYRQAEAPIQLASLINVHS